MKAILLLSGLGIIALFAELFRFRKALYPIVILGLLGTIATAVSYWWYDDGEYNKYFAGMIDFQGSAVVLSVIILSVALLWFVMSANYLRTQTSETDHTALVLFALVGALILTCYSAPTNLHSSISFSEHSRLHSCFSELHWCSEQRGHSTTALSLFLLRPTKQHFRASSMAALF
jgi:formate hydrogenlyase subunit 3/multisubunit Na+/H+ antiporter MnhD subunit